MTTEISENTTLTQDAEALVALLTEAAKEGILRRAVFSKPHDRSLQKTVLTVKTIGGKEVLQAETFHRDNKATHRNLPLSPELTGILSAMTQDFDQINLICQGAECEFRRSASGKTILLGGEKCRRWMNSPAAKTAPKIQISNNREKRHILTGDESFLRALGVSDAEGRVYDKKQAKFRQINRFLELIRDVEDKLPAGALRICDLCCGKSYLSFAVYHYFANIRGRQVRMTGVDRKPDVMEYCAGVAREAGFSGLEFLCGDITTYEPDELPALVISLHACDIATDLVLQKAAGWHADVILSTPCCHHELNRHIHADELSFITDYSMLRQKLCDAATDALRLCRLEAQGYSTAALELIDPEETPKNIMLRAVRRKNFDPSSPEAERLWERYRRAKEFLCGEETAEYFF